MAEHPKSSPERTTEHQAKTEQNRSKKKGKKE
jgi:hypothetical protein